MKEQFFKLRTPVKTEKQLCTSILETTREKETIKRKEEKIVNRPLERGSLKWRRGGEDGIKRSQGVFPKRRIAIS